MIERNADGNVILPQGYSQVFVVQGIAIRPGREREFVDSIAAKFDGARAVFLEIIETLPSKNKRLFKMRGTGGIPVVFFSIHDDDIERFEVDRLTYHLKRIEDVFSNEHREYGGKWSLYPERVRKYQKWDSASTDKARERLIEHYVNRGANAAALGRGLIERN